MPTKSNVFNPAAKNSIMVSPGMKKRYHNQQNMFNSAYKDVNPFVKQVMNVQSKGFVP